MHYSLIHHQSRVDSRTYLILGQTPTTSVLSAKQKRLQHTRKDYMKRPTQTTDIASGHNPGTYSHASSSGPLIRRRVTIHVEDHKPPKTNRQATNTQTTPQTRLTTKLQMHRLTRSTMKNAINLKNLLSTNTHLQEITKNQQNHMIPQDSHVAQTPSTGSQGNKHTNHMARFYKSHQRETDYTAGRLRP